jgi:hypothetical protein
MRYGKKAFGGLHIYNHIFFNSALVGGKSKARLLLQAVMLSSKRKHNFKQVHDYERTELSHMDLEETEAGNSRAGEAGSNLTERPISF